MLRKESHAKNRRSEIPRSAKQVELVKRAVSRSSEVLSPIKAKEGRLIRVVNKQSNIEMFTSVPSNPKFNTQVNSPKNNEYELEFTAVNSQEFKAETTKNKYPSSNASFKVSFTQ